jgi:hypothetical protein
MRELHTLESQPQPLAKSSSRMEEESLPSTIERPYLSTSKVFDSSLFRPSITLPGKSSILSTNEDAVRRGTAEASSGAFHYLFQLPITPFQFHSRLRPPLYRVQTFASCAFSSTDKDYILRAYPRLYGGLWVMSYLMLP